LALTEADLANATLNARKTLTLVKAPSANRSRVPRVVEQRAVHSQNKGHDGALTNPQV